MYYSKSNSIIILWIFFGMMFSGKTFAQEDTLLVERRDSSSEGSFTRPVYVIKGKTDFKTADAISYDLYLKKNWKILSIYGEQAVKADLDYYYMRVRLGVAYFELKQYRKAIEHFKKALEHNTGDDFAMSYLYACYQYSERYEEAKKLTTQFSPAMQEAMKSNDFSAIDFILVESGFKSVDNTKFQNPFFMSLGLGHSVARKVFLFHSGSYFAQRENRFRVEQFQYYLRANIPLKNNFLVSAGFHLLEVIPTYTVERIVFPQNGGQGQGQGQGQGPERRLEDSLARQINYIGAVTITKHLPLLDLSAGASAAKFDSTKKIVHQYQVNAGFAFYPLKNNRISLGTTLYYHYESDRKENNFAFAPFLNMYIVPKLFLGINYFTNKGSNITEGTGSFVSNSVDYTLSRVSFTASYKATSNVWVYGTFAYETKKYNPPDPRLIVDYYYKTLALGLKIIPQFK